MIYSNWYPKLMCTKWLMFRIIDPRFIYLQFHFCHSCTYIMSNYSELQHCILLYALILTKAAMSTGTLREVLYPKLHIWLHAADVKYMISENGPTLKFTPSWLIVWFSKNLVIFAHFFIISSYSKLGSTVYIMHTNAYQWEFQLSSS